MILRLFGIGILMFALFFALLFSFPLFFIWPFCPSLLGAGLLFLLLIGLGVYLLAQNRRIGQLVFGLTLLFAGLAFLTHNLWDINLLRFWPVLLIFLGLALILQRRPAQ